MYLQEKVNKLSNFCETQILRLLCESRLVVQYENFRAIVPKYFIFYTRMTHFFDSILKMLSNLPFLSI